MRTNPKARLKTYKDTGRKKVREFKLTDEAAIKLFHEPCYYCDFKAPGELNGLDRKDNFLDYIDGNCVPCCWRCNDGKGTLSADSFIDMCRRVAARHPVQRS